MEAEEVDVEQFECFEHPVSLHAGGRHVVRHVVPLAHEGVTAEGIATRPAQRVPVGHREAHLLAHGLAHDELVGVVPAEGEFAPGIRALVPDRVLDGIEGGHQR